MTSALRTKLTIFTVMAAAAVVFTGVRYAQLTDRFMDTTYEVTAALPTSGGLFANAEVTYRGVTVGKVTEVNLAPKGVVAVLAIRNGRRIPEQLAAYVHNRSAVGEQYIDLVPSRDGAPYLRDGAHLGWSQTRMPLPEEELIKTVDSFVTSIDTDNLRTVVSELGDAFSGTGDDLGRLIDNTNVVVSAANDNMPQTLALLDNSTRVLRTQADSASNLRSFSEDLAKVTGQLRDDDDTIRDVLDEGTPAARELRLLFDELSAQLPPLLASLVVLGRAQLPLLRALEVSLTYLPWNVAIFQAAVRDKRSYLGAALNQSPQVCQQGYIPANQWRSTNDLSVIPPPYDAACEEPDKVRRGSKRAP